MLGNFIHEVIRNQGKEYDRSSVKDTDIECCDIAE